MPPRRDPSEDGVLNPLSPGLAVLDARLPLLALALRSLGILLLGARLAGVLTAHLATLHLFHGGHHVRVLGGLVRFEYLPHLFRKAMSDLPKTGTRGGGETTGEKARRWSRRGGQQRFALTVMLTFIQQHSIFISISLSPFMHYGHTRHNRLVAPPSLETLDSLRRSLDATTRGLVVSTLSCGRSAVDARAPPIRAVIRAY